MYEKRSRIAPTPWTFAKYIISQRLTWHQVKTSDNFQEIIRNLEFMVRPGTSIRALCAGREGLFYKSSIGIIKMIYREFTDMPFTTSTPSDVFLWAQKSLYARIYAFSRFHVFYISIYIYSYKYIRNIGTNRTESRLSAGFAGVPAGVFPEGNIRNHSCAENDVKLFPSRDAASGICQEQRMEHTGLVNMPISGQMKRNTAHPVCMTKTHINRKFAGRAGHF